MDLPPNQSVFDFEKTSEFGKKYEGRFTVLCVFDMRTKHRHELEKTRLLGNYSNPTDELAGISVILANLRIRITDGPEWWKQSDGGYEISDLDILTALYDKVMVAESEWRTKLKEKAKQAKEATAAATTTPTLVPNPQ